MGNNITQSDTDSVVDFLKKNKKKFLHSQHKLKNLKLNGLSGLKLNIVFL